MQKIEGCRGDNEVTRVWRRLVGNDKYLCGSNMVEVKRFSRQGHGGLKLWGRGALGRRSIVSPFCDVQQRGKNYPIQRCVKFYFCGHLASMPNLPPHCKSWILVICLTGVTTTTVFRAVYGSSCPEFSREYRCLVIVFMRWGLIFAIQ